MLSYGQYAGMVYGTFFGLMIIYVLLFTFFVPIRDYAILLTKFISHGNQYNYSWFIKEIYHEYIW